jgi:hypothetical protein
VSVRVTKKVRRVLDRLAKSAATAREISTDTNINFPALWPVIDKLESNGWVQDTGKAYKITQAARDGIRLADQASMTNSKPGPRPGPRRSARRGRW